MRFTLASIASLTFVLSLGSLPLIACGGSTSDGGPQTTGTDSGAPNGDDTNADASTPTQDASTPDTSKPPAQGYPANHPPMPQVDYIGGRILEHTKVVTITFPGDTLADQLEAFGDVITTTPWWDTVGSEYCEKSGKCVGKGSNGGHVRMPTAAAGSYTDVQDSDNNSTIKTLIKDSVADGTLPAPDADTLYVVYLPAGTSISLKSGPQTASSCTNGGFGGYHQSTTVTPAGGTATDVAYAIVPRCSKSLGGTTVASSHEIIEAATDPDGGQGVAYYMISSSWGALGGGEVADLCVDFTGSNSDTVQESGFAVQRSWSNKAAKGSHDPCVPAPAGEVYFNVAPNKDMITAGAGKTVTLTATAFSDGPMDAWDVKLVDLSQYLGTDALTISIDKSTAANGDQMSVTVQGLSGQGAFFIVSSNGKQQHFWPVLVNAN